MDLDISNVIISLLSGSTAGLLVVAFLGKSLIGNFLKKDIDKYRSDLNTRAEAVQKELELSFHEKQVALTRLDTQTTEAFLAVFASIRDWEKRTSEFLDPNVFFDPEIDQAAKSEFDFFYAKAKVAVESAENMQAILQDNEIFFTKELYSRVSKFFLEATTGISTMMKIIETTKRIENPIPAGMKDWLIDSREELFERFHGEIARMKNDVISELRVKVHNVEDQI